MSLPFISIEFSLIKCNLSVLLGPLTKSVMRNLGQNLRTFQSGAATGIRSSNSCFFLDIIFDHVENLSARLTAMRTLICT